MPLINATWRVTHAGVVLLDWDDYVQAEPSLDRTFVSDRVAALGSAGVLNFGRQNASTIAAFQRVRVFDSDQAAREFMRAHTEALQACPDYLEIEWLNQFKGTTLANCVLTGYKAKIENNFFYADYSLAAGVLYENQVDLPVAAGNVDVLGSYTPHKGVLIIGPVGGGAFTRTVTLLAGTNVGDLRDIYISLDVATGPTVEVHDLTSGGTLLYTVTGSTGGPTHAVYRAQWNGTHWVASSFCTGGQVFFSGGPSPIGLIGSDWRLVSSGGHPTTIELQGKNASNVWETVWSYTTST